MLGNLRDAATPVHLSAEPHNEDWPKGTFDVFMGGKAIGNTEELRTWFRESGVKEADFVKTPAFTEAIRSGRYPWLAELLPR